MGRILGIDFGHRRVGIAVSDTGHEFARPLCMLDGTGRDRLQRELQKICEEQEVEKIIVGLPLNMDGSTGEMAREAQVFAAFLAGRLNIPVETLDERLSTALVERMLIEADMSRSRRKDVKDKLAAQVILQSYLDRTNIRNQITDEN